MSLKMKQTTMLGAAVATSIFYSSISLSEEPFSQKQGWVHQNNAVILQDASGKVLKRFEFTKEEKTLSTHPSEKFTERDFSSLNGGASKNGAFAWVDKRTSKWRLEGNQADYLFQYYGKDGKLLWEKKSIVNSLISDDGETILAFEVSPNLISTGDHEDANLIPKVYGASGNTILELNGCSSPAPSARLTKNGRYGSTSCFSAVPGGNWFFLIFNIRSKKIINVPVTGSSYVTLNENGDFEVVTRRKEFHPQTRKFIKEVEAVVANGSIK